MESLPLREIHLPVPVGLWPLASGWWILIAATLALLAFGLFLFLRHRKPTALKEALAKLDAYLTNQDLSAAARNQGISLLLRQLAISTEGRDEIAGLSGPAWIVWLEKKLPDQGLSEGMKHFLEQGPYNPHNEIRTDSPTFRTEITAALLAVGNSPAPKLYGKWMQHPKLRKRLDALLSCFTKRSSEKP